MCTGVEQIQEKAEPSAGIFGNAGGAFGYLSAAGWAAPAPGGMGAGNLGVIPEAQEHP